MTLNGSDPLEIMISETDGVKQVTVPAHEERVSCWGFSETYDIGECVLNIAEQAVLCAAANACTMNSKASIK